mmetsp:Transcript_52992/g.64943  ORF Transcript_52992/g.64943 Transcript_52992/m.64943 type:complete len:231 (-) Transcript_52992:22-714(-)
MAESQVSFKVSMMSGAEGHVSGDANEKILDVKGRILEALKLEKLSLSLFLDSADGQEIQDDQIIADLSDRSVLAVVQTEPEWCTNKRFRKDYIRGRRCGMEETSDDMVLQIFPGGTFLWTNKHHDHDAECGYNYDSKETANGQWVIRWDASKKVEVLELNGEATIHEQQRVSRGCYDYSGSDDDHDDGEDSDEEEPAPAQQNFDRTRTNPFQKTFSKADLSGWKISALET